MVNIWNGNSFTQNSWLIILTNSIATIPSTCDLDYPKTTCWELRQAKSSRLFRYVWNWCCMLVRHRAFNSCSIHTVSEFLFLHNSPQWARASSFTRFLDHTQRRTTLGTTPLDEWLAHSRDLYLTTHNNQNRQTSIPLASFEPTISSAERLQTYALDRAAAGTRTISELESINYYRMTDADF